MLTSGRLPQKAASKLRRLAGAALAFAATIANGSPLAAHHSFAAEFDASQPVRLAGTVSRVDWRNPHAWFYISVAGPSGTEVTWAIEATAPSALARRGLRPEIVRPGMKVIVSGYRAKDQTPRARGGYVRLPDGRTLSLGSPDAEPAHGVN